MFHRAAVDILWLGSLPTRIIGGYSDYYVAWRGNTPLLYHPSPLISDSLPTLKSMQNNGQLEYCGTWAWSYKAHEAPTTQYGIRRSLIDICSITEVKRRRARFISGWVTAWDCQVPYTLSWGSENHVNQMARLTDFELDVKEPQWT